MSRNAFNKQYWFGVCTKGRLHCLGEAGGFFKAQDVAMEKGLDVVWIVNPKHTEQWLSEITCSHIFGGTK